MAGTEKVCFVFKFLVQSSLNLIVIGILITRIRLKEGVEMLNADKK